MTIFLKNIRIKIILILVILIPLGFYTKVYAGPGSVWAHNSLGGVFYVIFWCLVAALINPQFPAWKNASLITAFTCLLEFAQLIKAGWLEFLRSYFIGRIVLGHSFHWLDFPYYLAGGIIAFFMMIKMIQADHKNTEKKY